MTHTADGSRSHPFGSFSELETKISNDVLGKKIRGSEPVYIILRGGNYFLKAPLTFGANSFGAGTNPVIIQAAPGERPVFTGGLEIRGWRKCSKNIPGLPEIARNNVWMTDAPKVNGKTLEFRQLWINGNKAIRAREPNAGNMDRLAGWNKTNQTALIPTTTLAGIRKPRESEMVIDQVWEIANLRVSKIEIKGTNAFISFKQPESKIEFEHPWPPVTVNSKYAAPFFLANAIQLLDSPGEWFEDIHAGKIYYWPRNGENPANSRVIAPALETLVKISGTPDKPISNVKFRGITFADTTWLRPSQSGHVPLQAGMFMLAAKKLSPRGTIYHPKLDNVAWVGRPPAAVIAKNANHISFENCTFEHTASAGLDFETGTRDDLVEGCIFRDIGGNGIQLGKFSDTNVEVHFPYNPTNKNEICSNEKIFNNLINDCGTEDWGCVGICVGYAHDIKIGHNEIFDLPYSGVSVGWGWTKMTNALRDNFIFANHIHHIGQMLGDLGGIYLLSSQPGTVVAANSISDISPSPYVPDPQHWFYLYADEGSSFETWRDNWSPAEKFLRNANGPGNVWTNNGPQVSDEIKNAAGLENHFADLLSEIKSQ
ncbi:MAG TPA: right-handed parallel beta-helix repeat-containing protein [Verrucomicrobiae bacterium]|nr:right-handed parallel beta-helix repeat-containing protein [Verrucomicrobiae bacterium]